jgi:hypothetical protein
MPAKPEKTLLFPAAELPAFTSASKMFMAGAKLQAHAFKAAMRYQIEALGFLKHRCEQGVKFIDELAASDEFNDAFDVLADFMRGAATDYSAEAGKMASIGSRLASDTARQVRRKAEETIEDFAAQTIA